MKKLYKNNFMYWRGKAGGYAKSGNENLQFANSQARRYALKYADESGFSDRIKVEFMKHFVY